MSTFSTGVGLISGLPINDLVDSLISIQRRPIQQLQARLGTISSQKAGLLKISAQVLAIQNAVARFRTEGFIQTARATSSNEDVVLATAQAGAPVGRFSLSVHRLAATHQVISRGFANPDQTPVGAGTITIETARAALNRPTALASLRAGGGIGHGRIRVVDRAGAAADIDLTAALTVDDVLAAFNSQRQANVAARVEGDRIILEDRTGLATGQLSVADLGAGTAAANLGLAGSSATGRLDGADLVTLSESTPLDELNDGNGVGRLRGQVDFSVSLADGTSLSFDLSDRLADATPLALLHHGAGVPAGTIRITNRAGAAQDIDLSTATTLADVKVAVEGAGLGLSVVPSGSGLRITDASDGTRATIIEDLSGGQTARALGIAGSFAGGTVAGRKVYFVETLGDVLRAINGQAGNDGRLTAAISADGRGLTLTDHTTGTGALAVTAENTSRAASDLGLLSPPAAGVITSRRLLAGLNTVLLRSLNGGAGVQTGVIQLTDRAGATAAVDLSTANSLEEVIRAINAAGTGLRAAVSANGLGIELEDVSGGTGDLSIADVSGTAAADLRIAGTTASSRRSSGNLQRQYLSTASRLSSIGVPGGFVRGRFRITDSAGHTDLIDLSQGDEEQLQDVINEINSRPNIEVVASLNATGDGLLLTDTAGGAGRLRVAEEGGATARSLGLLGEAAIGSTTLDGSLETRITVTGGDTLNDVVAAIKARTSAVQALILRHGGSSEPFRLSLAATAAGRDARLVIDTGTTGLGFDTLVEGRDAVVFLGPADSDAPLLLTSPTNTLTDALPGVRLDLVGQGNQPVTIDVARDVDAIARDVATFVNVFNAAISSIDELTRFDAQTQTPSILTGDPTVLRIRQRLLELPSRVIPRQAAPFNRLSGVGVSFGPGGALRLDEDKLRQAIQTDPGAVEALFSTKDTGFGAIMDKELKRLTDSSTGLFELEQSGLQQTEELLARRISAMEELIERRRQGLLAQFQATERVLAQLQSQGTALSGLASLSQGFSLLGPR